MFSDSSKPNRIWTVSIRRTWCRSNYWFSVANTSFWSAKFALKVVLSVKSHLLCRVRTLITWLFWWNSASAFAASIFSCSLAWESILIVQLLFQDTVIYWFIQLRTALLIIPRLTRRVSIAVSSCSFVANRLSVDLLLFSICKRCWNMCVLDLTTKKSRAVNFWFYFINREKKGGIGMGIELIESQISMIDAVANGSILVFEFKYWLLNLLEICRDIGEERVIIGTICWQLWFWDAHYYHWTAHMSFVGIFFYCFWSLLIQNQDFYKP